MYSRKLSIRTVSVKDIIEAYKAGILAIPEFQRDYVWKASKAPQLLDSLWNKFPIGALLTWSSDERVQSRVRARVTTPTQWIIDGQQRTRTLVKILDGELPVLFNIREKKFLLENAATRRALDPTLVPVSEIWGTGYVGILKNIEDFARNIKDQKDLEQNLQLCKDLLQFEIPQVHLEGHTLLEAINAFSRINTQGMRLKASDIEVAALTVKHSGFVKQQIQPFLDSLKQRGWDRIYLSQLFIACEGIAEKGNRKLGRKRLHDLTTQELKEAWRYLVKGVDEAIAMLNDELGITDMSIFPSGNMLMPVAVLCSGVIKSQPKTREIVKWLISASITKRYSQSSQEKLDQDIYACFSGNPIQQLNKLNRSGSKRSKIRPNKSNLESPLHDKYGIFLTYLACRFSGMQDLFDGRKVGSSSSEKHHIIPRASLPKNKRRILDNTANIAFILGRTNQKITNRNASEYILEIESPLLKSQCVPENLKLLTTPHKFMEERAKLMSKVLELFLFE